MENNTQQQMKKKKVINARTAGEISTKEKKPPVTVFKAWCKGCGICIAFCPQGVLDFDEDGKSYPKNPEKCIKCMQCELRCPDFAITVNQEEE